MANVRGMCGFIVDGEKYLQYIHRNCEPWLRGQRVIGSFLDLYEKYSIEEIREKILAMRLVEGMEYRDEIPESEREYAEDDDGNLTTWPADYKRDRKKLWVEKLLPHSTNLLKAVEDGIFMQDAGFADVEAFNTWSYIFDMDSEELRISVSAGARPIVTIPFEFVTRETAHKDTVLYLPEEQVKQVKTSY
jgi:hypothetical protein